MTPKREEGILATGVVLFIAIVCVSVWTIGTSADKRQKEIQMQADIALSQNVYHYVQEIGKTYDPFHKLEQALERNVKEFREESIILSESTENEEQAPVTDSLPCPSTPDNQ